MIPLNRRFFVEKREILSWSFLKQCIDWIPCGKGANKDRYGDQWQYDNPAYWDCFSNEYYAYKRDAQYISGKPVDFSYIRVQIKMPLSFIHDVLRVSI